MSSRLAVSGSDSSTNSASSPTNPAGISITLLWVGIRNCSIRMMFSLFRIGRIATHAVELGRLANSHLPFWYRPRYLPSAIVLISFTSFILGKPCSYNVEWSRFETI